MSVDGSLQREKLLLRLLLCMWIVEVRCYKVPAAIVEPLENGFRVFIPDERGVKRVDFNVNRNRNFTDFEEGEFKAQVRKPQDGRWQHDFVRAPLRAHDTVYIWTNVQHGNAIYRDQALPQQVCQLAGDYLPANCTLRISTPRSNLVHVTSPSLPCGEESETVVSPPPTNPTCKGKLIFEEDFDTLNESLWLHEVRAPLDNADAEFVLYDGKARIRSGQLIIEPKLWSSYRPDLHITNAHLDLSDRCTGTHNRQKECVLLTSGPLILPPVVVPRLSTKESFGFKFGRVEIRAKLPKGDWLVPLLLLEPLMESYGQTGYESGQLRVAMTRGNDQLRLPHGKLIDGRTLYAGAVLSTEASQREDFFVQQRRSTHFGDDFHVYGLIWTSQSLRFSIDGQDYGELLRGFAESDLNASWRRGGPMAPFDRMFYITLGLSVGGFGDFVDELRTANFEKPWINKHPQAKLKFWQSQDQWLPTWKKPKLIVDYVRVYAI
ncbi:gram-negative bacteria-binding protein 1 [Drosophila grimshawi]|uniref:GH14368 n=1 Tax=Drosophila grimshawi TaxID=7222 RepID=B4J1U7_DROGR|nr:gram-negative bacteria-binding protein 1 [Drosophila grimshawi]XP_032599127.1 gram-negative bacteria-binding protein 1 [Drosophila grimshawi]EDV98027.1 GH14368 [Drosophila grimshawi]